jgi:hypothetical protein
MQTNAMILHEVCGQNQSTMKTDIFYDNDENRRSLSY